MGKRQKFNASRRAKILAALDEGATHAIAARSSGICPRTLYLWLERGRKARSGAYREFAEAFDHKEAEVEQRLSRIVMTGALSGVRRDKDGKVIGVDTTDARWLLQNRYNWGKRPHETQRIQVEHTHQGSEDQPVKVEHVVDLAALVDKLAAAPLEVVEHLAAWTAPQEDQEPTT